MKDDDQDKKSGNANSRRAIRDAFKSLKDGPSAAEMVGVCTPLGGGYRIGLPDGSVHENPPRKPSGTTP